MLMRQILARERFPIRVHIAVDGTQAVHILEAKHFMPDLVILDLNIPKIPGLSVLESTEPNLPVVVFTSSSNPQDRQRAMALGAKEYVVKPTDLDEFSQAVSGIVRRWADAA